MAELVIQLQYSGSTAWATAPVSFPAITLDMREFFAFLASLRENSGPNVEYPTPKGYPNVQ